MLMGWTLKPQGLAINNNYILELYFENDENNNFWLHNVKILFPENNIEIDQKIEIEFSKSFFKFLRDRKYFRINICINNKIVFPHKFEVLLQVRRKLMNSEWSSIFNYIWLTQILQIKPVPKFNAFVSRSIREEENKIPNFFTRIISMWGFNTYTIGVSPLNPVLSDEELLDLAIIEIKKSDVVFAVATKRDQILKNFRWKTFEWLQSETALAYAFNKMIIIFVENGVDFSGLASKLHCFKFDSRNKISIVNFFDEYMPKIREYIEKRKNTEGFLGLLKAGALITGISVIGWLGYELGKTELK